jgi:FixJ family two-component response regulator
MHGCAATYVNELSRGATFVDTLAGAIAKLRHRLKAAGISVPVIYKTGNDNPAVRVAALQSGCVAYLTKPFSAKSLIEPLEKASAALT